MTHNDNDTPAENPYAKVVRRIVREEFDAFEARAVEREGRIASRLLEILSECRADRESDKLRIDELERQVQEDRDTDKMRIVQLEQAIDDHESRLRHIEAVLQRAGADTVPPTSGEMS